MANDRIIEEIKQRLPLEEYIGRMVDLKRAGRTFKACCPFHAEKTPSFVVFPHTQTWHCFGSCGDGGDLFSFVQKREGLNFAETLQLLARQAGVALEEESPEQQSQRSERDKYLAICAAAATLFQEWLRDRPDAQLCRDYIAKRGLSADTVNRFGLGYAPDSWDTLLNALTERGYDIADLTLLGLVRQRDNGATYDYFRQRLMFPIRDVRGRVIGFGARALTAEQTPKYLNSPQTPLFDKGRNLFALELGRDAIRSQNRAVVVEGYMDAITAHQHNFSNVVASLGTALTANQIQLLTRYSPNITLALDADEAGQKAAERGLDTVMGLQKELKTARWERARQGKSLANQPEGDIRVSVLPDGDDPDDLIRRDPVRWQKLIESALPVVEFLIQRRARTSDLGDPVQKARVADDLLPMISEIESAVVRDHYVRQLARLLKTDERVLAQDLIRHKNAPKRNTPPPKRATGESNTSQQGGGYATIPPANQPPPYFDEYEIPPEAYTEDYGLEGDGDAPYTPPQPPLNAHRQFEDERVSAHSDSADTILTEEEALSYQPRTHEGYALYLLLEAPERIGEAEQYGMKADMWMVTEHREIWEALLANPPASGVHLEEFAEHLVPPVAQRLRHLVTYYAAYPPLLDENRNTELLNQLDAVILSHEAEQERQLQYLIDDLQRTDDYERTQLIPLQRQLYQLTVNRFQRQRLRQERQEHKYKRHGTPTT
jgi:DNA primase